MRLFTHFFISTNAFAAASIVSTSLYYDCCQPSASVTSSLKAVTASGAQATPQSENGCVGSPDLLKAAFSDPSQHAYAVDEKNAIGYASAYVLGGNSDLACACFELTFTDTVLKDKKMTVQINDVNYQLGDDHIALQIPGSASGLYDQGCKRQYGSQYEFGTQFDSFVSISDCYKLPVQLQNACEFRFTWFKNALAPHANVKQIECPSSITSVSQCSHKMQSSPLPQVAKPIPGFDGSPSPKSPPSIAGPIVCTNKQWQQCAGRDFMGQTCCPQDTKCVVFNEYYAQCQ
jgi:hypothetical protein